MGDSKTILEATLTLVLAGGRGTRLFPLTAQRPKSAVPIGGLFRLIDFTLSNCLNSGLRKLLLLTQYKYESLHRYVRDGWSGLWNKRHGDTGEYILCLAPVSGKRYRGTADAIYQNMEIIARENPEFVLVLSGDRIYRMDYTELLQRHSNSGAAVTVAEVRQPARRKNGSVNMGVYVFTTKALMRAVSEDAGQVTNHDLEADIIPLLIQSVPICAYAFAPYWRDIRTIDSYYESNMELAQAKPPFDPYTNGMWPIRTPGYAALHPSEMVLPLAKGVRNSVISPGVHIARDAEVENSVVMRGAIIGKGARVRRAIVEEGVEILPGSRIGFDAVTDRARYPISENGVVVVTAGGICKSAWDDE
jgi:glucose-1-phosphate adenylyltransferase